MGLPPFTSLHRKREYSTGSENFTACYFLHVSMSNWNPLPTSHGSNVLNGGHCKLACSWRRWCRVLPVPAATTLHGYWYTLGDFPYCVHTYVCMYVQFVHSFCMYHHHKGVIGMNVCASAPLLFHALSSELCVI